MAVTALGGRWPALVFVLSGGCSGTLAPAEAPIAELVAAPPEPPERCTEWRLPHQLTFRCMSASVDDDLVPPALLDELAEALRADPRTRRVRIVGTRSPSPPEHHTESEHLALDRARAVAAGLAARGVEPAILRPEAGPDRGFFTHKRATKERAPPCPPPAEDRGHRSRRVELDVLRCEPAVE